MNLMTFSTFLFISTIGLVFTSKFFTVKNQIPLKGYVKTVSMFFIVNVVNNQALNYHVPVPLHIIFRSVCTSKLHSFNSELFNFRHFVSLPFFLIMGGDIVSASTKLSASAPYALLPWFPSLWVDLFASCVLQ
ncbi:hypothetical protein CRE_17659 [Caenorhabditis remanei]|uniref:Uncharacterized protein n=1 Tax=Caenorhabditis remanei TaxID=31234 RepID=E3NMV0_CAERE|nr:hypothetical protein CRE_17659 [Caenorhabditis remanei]